MISTVGAGGGGAESPSKAPVADQQERIPLGGTGTTGDWQVTVTGVDTVDSYGDEFTREQAEGVFKVVSIDVENAGAQANYFDAENVSLRDADGNQHSSHYTLAAEDVFMEQVNPGNTVSGEIVFDVPAEAQIDTVEVEDLMSMDEPLKFEPE